MKYQPHIDETIGSDAPPGLDVWTVDNLLPQPRQVELLAYLRECRWKFGWKSNRKAGDEFSFWHAHFAGHRNAKAEKPYPCVNELAKTAPLVYACWDWLSYSPGSPLEGHTLVRCYSNAFGFGDGGTLHTDSRKPNSYTAVYYPHLSWDPSWGGETVIFNADRSDIVRSIYPTPNRLAVFRGDLPHVARGVSRICPELRITLMFKTTLGDAADDQ